jgi:hypothetical protein
MRLIIDGWRLPDDEIPSSFNGKQATRLKISRFLPILSLEEPMKKIVTIMLLLAAGTLPAGAVTGIDICVKGGLVENYEQPGLTISTYDLSRLNLLGGQIYVAAVPLIDVIVAADYSWRTKTYDFAGQTLEFKMKDFAVTASAVYPVKLGLATFYAGGGVGSYALSYEYIRSLTLSLAENGITIPGSTTYFGYHGVAGAKLKLPVIPFGIFVEGRMNWVNAPGDDIKFNSVTGGAFLSLP